MRKKVCFVSTTRADYSYLKWIMKEVEQSTLLQLQLIVTGTHLSPDYGFTVKFIKEDGFIIDKKIEYLLSTKSSVGIAKSMGLCGVSFVDALNDLQPDILVVIGDRYELLPICGAALILQIPIAHLSGGDITLGAIDNNIRNAITMMANLHFPETEESKDNIIRMTGCSDYVFSVGGSSLDNFSNSKLMTREELADDLKLDISKKWILVTLHPETKMSIEYSVGMANNIVEAVSNLKNAEIIVTQSNADLGGTIINEFFENWANTLFNVHFFKTLGVIRYMSFIKQSWCIVGNSSSGVTEAPFLGVPAVNIGNRQKGRYLCSNVVQIDSNVEAIKNAIESIKGMRLVPDYYYGDGQTSKKIVDYITKFLNSK